MQRVRIVGMRPHGCMTMSWILASSLVEAGLTCSAELPETWGHFAPYEE